MLFTPGVCVTPGWLGLLVYHHLCTLDRSNLRVQGQTIRFSSNAEVLPSQQVQGRRSITVRALCLRSHFVRATALHPTQLFHSAAAHVVHQPTITNCLMYQSLARGVGIHGKERILTYVSGTCTSLGLWYTNRSLSESESIYVSLILSFKERKISEYDGATFSYLIYPSCITSVACLQSARWTDSVEPESVG